MDPHQKKIADEIGGSKFFSLGIEALEDEMRIIMLVACNADQRKTIHDRQMDSFELVGCQSLHSRQEELIARSQTIFRDLAFPNDRTKRGTIILRGENLQAFVAFLICVREILAVNPITEPCIAQPRRRISDCRKLLDH
jgi:hypothetical protein